MKSICFFSSYYIAPRLPKYVKFYLSELKRHFPEIVFLTNEKTMPADDIQFLESLGISLKLYKNEGYDFGMWYKAFKEYNVTEYDRIGLVNDSCILFNKLDFYFDWLNKNNVDYSGLTDCNIQKYHVQSYFIVINKKAIPSVVKYFEINGIISDLTQLIKTYEVGLSNYLQNAGMNIAAYYSFKNYTHPLNPSWMKAKELIKAGYPLVKKKILIRYYGAADWRSLIANGFDPYPNHYIKLMKQAAPETNINELLSGLSLRKTLMAELKFHSLAVFFRIYSILKKIKLRILGKSFKGSISIGANI